LYEPNKHNPLSGHKDYLRRFEVVIFQAIQNILFLSSIPVWSNYRPVGRMWPSTAFSVARGIIQEKYSYLKFVEKRVRLHLSHWIAFAG